MDPEISRLTKGLARCEDAAWREFHDRHHAALTARILSRGVAPSEASEILQKVYLRMLRHIRAFDEPEAFQAWLNCLIRCEVIDAARRVKRRSWLGERFQQWSKSRTETAPARDLEPLRRAMHTLADADRHLVSRHYLEGWSQEQLAADAGTTVKAVESKLARLRTRLRKQLHSLEKC